MTSNLYRYTLCRSSVWRASAEQAVVTDTCHGFR